MLSSSFTKKFNVNNLFSWQTFSVLLIIALCLPEYGIFLAVQYYTILLTYKYHTITACFPTKHSIIFHTILTFICGLSSFSFSFTHTHISTNMNHLQLQKNNESYFYSTFIFLTSTYILIWFLALSNIKPKIAKINQADISYANRNASNLNSTSNPMPNNRFLYDSNLLINNSITDDNKSIIKNIQNIDENENNLTLEEKKYYAIPNNLYQNLIGFTPVHSTYNSMNNNNNTFEYNYNSTLKTIENMNISFSSMINISVYFQSLILSLFGLLFICFFGFHVLLIYRSQHSLRFLKKSFLKCFCFVF